jgi:signal transduction histidine kinase
VLANLVSNAIRYAGEDGQVALRALREDGAVCISVSDTGPGIEPDALPHIFDRFWHARHDERAGAGLGLHICRRIVEAHDGHIRVETAQGGGTTFHVVLPA